jgi:hypothetical protein
MIQKPAMGISVVNLLMAIILSDAKKSNEPTNTKRKLEGFTRSLLFSAIMDMAISERAYTRITGFMITSRPGKRMK